MAGPFIQPDSDIDASIFIRKAEANATPANDEGRVPLLEATGKVHAQFLSAEFGGSGSDGDLAVSSGNTNIDLGGARYVTKNYKSISITGTGSITFTNPHANGSFIMVKCQGNFTVTSSAAPAISAVGCGSAGGNGATLVSTNGTVGTLAEGLHLDVDFGDPGNYAGTSGAAGGSIPTTTTYNVELVDGFIAHEYQTLAPGAGGGGGSCAGSAGTAGGGGRGGGVLIFEIAGTVNFTTTNGISAAGQVGVNAAGGTGTYAIGGGGGGGGGVVIFRYKTSTAITGTITVAGGTGGTTRYSGYSGARTNGGGGASIKTAGNTGATDGGGGGAGGAGVSIVVNV